MKKKYKLILFCFFCIIGITFVYNNFHFKNNNKEIIYNGNQLMVSVDGVTVTSLPTEGHYYLASYDCKSKNTNVSWNRDTYQLSVSNGNKNGGVSCYLDFRSTPKLSLMKVGSFVEYVGNNGCDADTCGGQSKTYCGNPESKFYYDGYRIAYSKGNTAYLISAGSPECVNHINLDQVSLKYCNANYVYNGICDINSIRNMNAYDFNVIISKGLDMVTCDGVQNKKCGYTDDLIDNGSDYWYTDFYNNSSDTSFYWASHLRTVSHILNTSGKGLRPIIRMDSNVIVVDGDGTYEHPYKIANYSFLIGKQDHVNKTLNLQLFAYNVDKVCVNLNSTVCTNYVPFQDSYTLDISKANDKDNIIYVYYKDSNDNIVATIHRNFNIEK